MRLPRRKFLSSAASTAALPFMPRLAKGQTYPSVQCTSSLALPPAVRSTFWRASLANGSRSSSANHSLLKIDRVPPEASRPKRWRERARTATRSLSQVRPTQSMRRSTTISISSLSTTLRRSPASARAKRDGGEFVATDQDCSGTHRLRKR